MTELETYIVNQLDKYEREKEIIVKNMKNKLKDVETKIRELRKGCPHTQVKYYPDPSGNNDSSYFCQICKSEVEKSIYMRAKS